MKLQVNNSGSWKNVSTFAASDLAKVQDSAHRIGRAGFAVAYNVSFRVLDDCDAVAWHWTPAAGWRAWVRPSDARVG